MKLYWLGAAFIVVLSVSGCKLLNKLTQFYINYHTSYTYPAGLPVDIPIIGTQDITTNTEQEFKNNNTQKDLVQSIKLNQLTLTITPEGQQTFSFLKSVEVYINAPGQPETMIASKYDIPNSVGSKLELDVNNVELRNYLIADSFGLRIKSVTDETVHSGITVDIFSRFFVDAKILGI